MRFDMILSRLQTEAFFVEPNFANGVLESMQGGSLAPAHTEVANNSVTYQKIGNVALIGVDGPMYKKDLNAMCMSVVSYDQLIKAHDQAENDDTVSKMLYRVDTPGGSVAGLEEFRQRIADSKKEIYVYAENLLASAGMYAFTAAKKVYANESTILGSIGVIVMYKEPKEKTLAIVSSNAPNKYCDISDEKCQSKMKARLDEYENIFLSKLEEAYPDKERSQIIEDFDRGGTIFAKAAKNLGYVDEVLPFQSLLTRLVEDETLSSEKTANKNDKGIVMTTEELTAQLQDANATIEALQTEISGLQSQLANAQSFNLIAQKAVLVGMEHGASAQVIQDAMAANSEEQAENMIFKAVMTNGAITVGEPQGAAAQQAQEDADDEALLAFAKMHRI